MRMSFCLHIFFLRSKFRRSNYCTQGTAAECTSLICWRSMNLAFVSNANLSGQPQQEICCESILCRSQGPGYQVYMHSACGIAGEILVRLRREASLGNECPCLVLLAQSQPVPSPPDKLIFRFCDSHTTHLPSCQEPLQSSGAGLGQQLKVSVMGN